MDAELEKDLKTLGAFIESYCRRRHKHLARGPATLKTHEVEAIVGRELRLCAECRKLLAHSFVKRTRCPLSPKPACRHCPDHCYHPRYRAEIRRVMRSAGWRFALRNPLAYLHHMRS